jgi:hypothetical protein
VQQAGPPLPSAHPVKIKLEMNFILSPQAKSYRFLENMPSEGKFAL